MLSSNVLLPSILDIDLRLPFQRQRTIKNIFAQKLQQNWISQKSNLRLPLQNRERLINMRFMITVHTEHHHKNITCSYGNSCINLISYANCQVLVSVTAMQIPYTFTVKQMLTAKTITNVFKTQIYFDALACTLLKCIKT